MVTLVYKWQAIPNGIWVQNSKEFKNKEDLDSWVNQEKVTIVHIDYSEAEAFKRIFG